MIELFKKICSHKEHGGRKGWRSARNTETFIVVAAKGHGSPAERGHEIRRSAPAWKGLVALRKLSVKGEARFHVAAGGPFRVRQGERREVRGVGTARGGNLFTAMTPGPCRDRRRRSFAEGGFRVHAQRQPRTLSCLPALNTAGSADLAGEQCCHPCHTIYANRSNFRNWNNIDTR